MRHIHRNTKIYHIHDQWRSHTSTYRMYVCTYVEEYLPTYRDPTIQHLLSAPDRPMYFVFCLFRQLLARFLFSSRFAQNR